MMIVTLDSWHLIGTVYFKKNASGFGSASPAAHFKQFTDPAVTVEKWHSAWLDDIRQNISYRIKFENEMVPSHEALKLHWQRTCWVLHMWKQADSSRMVLEPITQHGWSLTDGTLTFVWDTTANIKAVRDRVKLLMKGYKCVTGCTRCKCRKSNRLCSEGCECINCTNISRSIDNPEEREVVELAIEEEVTTHTSDFEDTEDLLDSVFGPGQADVECQPGEGEDI